MPLFKVNYKAKCVIEADTLEEAQEMFLNHEGCEEIIDEEWHEIDN